VLGYRRVGYATCALPDNAARCATRKSSTAGEPRPTARSPDVVDAARRLGRHYIAARYPDAHAAGPAGDHYGASDAGDAIADVEGILAFVDQAWQTLE
jgi:HEPN domain-containing protein